MSKSLKWEVFPCRFGKQIGKAVIVRAPDKNSAINAGRYWRGVIHMPRARELAARQYNPARDPAWGGYIIIHNKNR